MLGKVAGDEIKPAGIGYGKSATLVDDYTKMCNFEAALEATNISGEAKYILQTFRWNVLDEAFFSLFVCIAQCPYLFRHAGCAVYQNSALSLLKKYQAQKICTKCNLKP